jgi:hypothetical protein
VSEKIHNLAWAKVVKGEEKKRKTDVKERGFFS